MFFIPDEFALNDNLDFIKGFASIEMTVPFGADEASGSEYRPILQPKSTKFEFGFTGGAKYFFTDRIGIRLQAQLLIPIEWGGVYYSSGGSVFTTGGSLLQLNFTGGLIVRLG